MIYIFFTALFVYINFHGNWPNDSLLPASTSFRAMLHVVMDDNAFCSIEALSQEISRCFVILGGGGSNPCFTKKTGCQNPFEMV